MENFEAVRSFLSDLIRPIVREAVKESMPKEEDPMKARYITIRQSRDLYNLTPATIYRRFQEGTLTPFKNGGRTLLDRREIEEMIQRKQFSSVAPYNPSRKGNGR